MSADPSIHCWGSPFQQAELIGTCAADDLANSQLEFYADDHGTNSRLGYLVSLQRLVVQTFAIGRVHFQKSKYSLRLSAFSLPHI